MRNINKIILIFVVSTYFSFVAQAAEIKQGPAIEQCSYGEGESSVSITIHKELKKGLKKTADVKHGSHFARYAIPLESMPGSPDTAFAGSNKEGNKTILNMSFGPSVKGSMNFDADGVVFETNELNCKKI